jgi:hypothetical protein
MVSIFGPHLRTLACSPARSRALATRRRCSLKCLIKVASLHSLNKNGNWEGSVQGIRTEYKVFRSEAKLNPPTKLRPQPQVFAAFSSVSVKNVTTRGRKAEGALVAQENRNLPRAYLSLTQSDATLPAPTGERG